MSRRLFVFAFLYLFTASIHAQIWSFEPTFRISETRIEKGDSVELNWDVPYARKIWLDSADASLALAGSVIKSPDTTTIYTLYIQKNKRKLLKKRRKVTVTSPRVVFFELPDSATDENRVTLRWQTENADFVLIEGYPDTLPTIGSVNMSFDTTSNVRLGAYGKYQTDYVEDSIEIAVIEDFYVDKPWIYRGDTIRLHWKTKLSNHTILPGLDSILPSIGSIRLKPQTDTVFRMYVSRNHNEISLFDSIYLRVREPGIRYFWGESSILKGDWATLTWSVNGYDRVSIDKIGENLPRTGARRVKPDKTTTYVLRVQDGEQEISMSKTLKVFPFRKYISDTRHVERVPENVPMMLDILSVDRSAYPDKIKLRAVVVDTSGYYISGLAAKDKQGQPRYQYFRQLSEMSDLGRKTLPFEVREIQETASTPYDIAMVLDYSGSMGGIVKYLEKALRNFISQKYINDRISVTRFDDQIRTDIPLTQTADSIFSQLKFNGLRDFGGHTAMYAAADLGLKTLRSSKNHKVVVLFTDGNENASFQHFGEHAFTASQVAREIRENNARLIIISYGTGTNTEVLYELAALSDGKIYFVHSPDFIEQVFHEMPRVLHQYYEIVYKPREVDGDHRVYMYYKDRNKTGNAYFDFHVGDSYSLSEYELDDDEYWYREIDGKKPVSAPQIAVNFVFNEEFLRDEYMKNLDKFLKYLKAYPDTELDILAHADHVGSDEQCLIVTKRRSESVRKYFVDKGIATERLHTRPMGKRYPIWPQEKEAWQAAENRRVELILYE